MKKKILIVVLGLALCFGMTGCGSSMTNNGYVNFKNADNKYIDMFRLNRGLTIKKIINLTIYNYNNMKNYILTKLNNSYTLIDNVRIETKDNIKYGVYRNKNGKEFKVKNTCPHMKCNLIFNSIDKTWDCPCHGSRFDIYGNSIMGPSVYNIKVED